MNLRVVGVLLVRSALRVVAWKRLETVALILVTMAAVVAPASLAIIKSNLEYQIYELFRDVSGDVMLTGRIPSEALTAIKGLEGVGSVNGMIITFGLLGEERVLVGVMGHEAFDSFVKLYVIREGRFISGPGEAVVYRAMFVRGPVEMPGVGDEVDLVVVTGQEPVLLKLRVVGLATGYNHIGPTPFMVVIDEELLRRVMNYTMTAVRLEVVGDPRGVAGEARYAIESLGGSVSWHVVNVREENPVVLIAESVMSVMTLPVLIFIAMAPVLSASLGLATVVRDSRNVAVMKAMGCGLWELFLAYTLPWVLRAAFGALLGFMLSPFIARWLYLSYFAAEEDLSRALYERFGFNPYWGTSAYYTLLVLGLTLLGSLIPLAVAYKVNVVNVIAMVGLHAHPTPKAGWSMSRPVVLRMWVRDMVARWWKTVGLVVSLSLLMGLGSSGVMLSNGVGEWVKAVEDRSSTPFDAILIISTVESPERLPELLDKIGYVKRYFASTPYSLASAIEGLTFVELRAPVKGDPSVEFPLIQGRYPVGRGEVAVSHGLASYRGLRVGDVLELRDTFGRVYKLEVVGITRAYHDRGFQLLLTQDSLVEITGYRPGLGRAFTVKVAVELEDPHRVEELLERLKSDVERAGPYGVEVISRSSISETFKAYSTMVTSIATILSLLASVVVAVVAASIIASDISARAREIAVLTSLGLQSRQIVLGFATQLLVAVIAAIPVAYITSKIIAGMLAERTVNFAGYIEPTGGLETMATATTITPLLTTMIIVVLATTLTVRRLDLVRALSDI
ncbi:MAG: FtsX-like permease family protein [Acidilobaceae archaeon]